MMVSGGGSLPIPLHVWCQCGQVLLVWWQNVETNILFQKNANNYFFKTPLWGTSKIQRLDPKICADSSWLPIYKMVWNFTIGSAVWMLELSKVVCKDFCEFFRRRGRRSRRTLGSILGWLGKGAKKKYFFVNQQFTLAWPRPPLTKSEPPYYVCFSSGPIVALKKMYWPIRPTIYIWTIGIIWSLTAKWRLIIKKYLYFGQKKKKWTTGSFGQTPPPP